MVQNHRKSNFIRWLSGLTICCLAVIASDIFPENRLLEFAAILIALLVFLLSFALVFTNLRTALLGITAGAICFSVLANHWPAKFRFSISRNDLNQFVDAYSNDSGIEMPIWCGSYRIKQIERRGDSICLWTDLTPRGYTGLVFTPDDQERRYFNIWNEIEISPNWSIISED